MGHTSLGVQSLHPVRVLLITGVRAGLPLSKTRVCADGEWPSWLARSELIEVSSPNLVAGLRAASGCCSASGSTWRPSMGPRQ